MTGPPHWRSVYDFWFPPQLGVAAVHRRKIAWWFDGGATAALPPYRSTVKAAATGQLDSWADTPQGRLTLILTLDQFPRGLFAGTTDAYATDHHALRLAERGIAMGHYDSLAEPWEKTFFLLPLAHTEGPGHAERLHRVVAMTEAITGIAPEPLRGFYEFSAGQARANLEVITRFGRFPHRNPVIGRRSTDAERRYLEIGDFIHHRRPPGHAGQAAVGPQSA